MTDQMQVGDALVGRVADADFARTVLDHDDPARVAVVLFHRGDRQDSVQMLAALEQVAADGYEVVRLDIDAEDSRETAARFAVNRWPMLMLFRRGTLRSIFDWNSPTATSVRHWIEREADDLRSSYEFKIGQEAGTGMWRPGGAKFADVCPSIPTLDVAAFERDVLKANDPEAVTLVHFFLRKERVSISLAAILEQVAENGWNVVNADVEEKAAEGTLKVAARFAFGTLPTLLLFRGGTLEAQYAGRMDPVSIGQWASGLDGKRSG